MSVWRALADGTVVLHFAFLLYLLIGGFVACRWPRTIWLHAAAVVWAVLIISTKVPCPLTAAQNAFRAQQGLGPLRYGFIEVYVRGTFYPAGAATLTQVCVAVLIALSWAAALHSRRRETGTLRQAHRSVKTP